MKPSALTLPRRLLAVAAVSVLAVAACGGSDDADAGPSAEAPTDRVLNLSFLQDPGQPPDPDIYYAGQGLLLTTNMYEGLLQYKRGVETPELEPALAESWTVSEDNLSYTFTLREGVVFHDGTPFTSAAVKASIDRRLAVNQGPAYMVADVADVVPNGDFEVTITLSSPTTIFLDFLASPYGLRMLSPTALEENAGDDFAATYLQTNSIGTGPYVLSDAQVGSRYAMTAFEDYWGPEPYFTEVNIPVITDSSSQQLQFGEGELAAILHDLPTSAVASYLADESIDSYSLKTLMSDYLYINPNTPFGSEQVNRNALQQAIDREAIFEQAYAGRGSVAESAYPGTMVAEGEAPQEVEYDPAVLTELAPTLPEDQKAVIVGYDSNSPDNQLVANLISTQLTAAGLDATVQSFTTSQIFGWVSDTEGAPDVLATLGWPDAAPEYTWAHISWDPGAGLNYLQCSDEEVTELLADGLVTGDAATFSEAGTKAIATGCWLNLVNQNDFMVAQPWLAGVEEAHNVTHPNSLYVAALSVEE